MKLNALILIITFPLSLYAAGLSEDIVTSDQYLSKVRDMIRQEQEIIKSLKDEKRKTAKELKKAELELGYHRKLSKKLEQKLTTVRKEIGSLTFKHQEIMNRQDELRKNIKAANFYLAGAGETELLEALILSDELSELTAGLQIITKVNTRLFGMVEELDKNRKELDSAKAELEKAKAEQEEALKEKKSVLAELTKKRTLVKQLHKITAEDEKIQTEYIALLKQKEDELENRLKKLYADLKKEKENSKFNDLHKNFAGSRKKLMRPVTGKIIEKFGTKKVDGFKGVIHKKGIKINPGEPHVASVYDGVVMHTDTAWGLGYFVIVEHYGGYYTLYANMDDVKVKKGQKVHVGEILGTIDIDRGANTPYLYFEIRIHDKAVDPEEWLTAI